MYNDIPHVAVVTPGGEFQIRHSPCLQVTGMKREYEKLQRHYSKHSKEANRDKQRAAASQEDLSEELKRLQGKLKVEWYTLGDFDKAEHPRIYLKLNCTTRL